MKFGMIVVGSPSDESPSAARERGVARDKFARSGRGSARDSLHGVCFFAA